MPKIIHYCWFGGNKKSKLEKKCILSWHEIMPDVQIIEWNERNINLKNNNYAMEAFENKKWAFVSDYVRLFVLYNFGGIYLDTDVELFRDISKFLKHNFFSGFEVYNGKLHPITAVMGAKKGNKFIKDLLNEYENDHFINPDGSYNMETNTKRIAKKLVSLGIDSTNDCHQVVGDDIHIYPSTFFCTKGPFSYATHYFEGSWIPKKIKIGKYIKKIIGKIFK
jgi:mannosyltransferase OCH1-like enzyme